MFNNGGYCGVQEPFYSRPIQALCSHQAPEPEVQFVQKVVPIAVVTSDWIDETNIQTIPLADVPDVAPPNTLAEEANIGC